MWNDEKFRRLSAPPPNGQTLWQRLLTGPELGVVPGLFAAWDVALAKALGWSLEGFAEAFAEVFREHLAEADFEVGLVWVPNAIVHNRPESPNVVRSWRVALAELPECPLKDKALHALAAFLEGMGEGFAEAFREASPKPFGKPSPNQEQEQEQEINTPLAPEPKRPSKPPEPVHVNGTVGPKLRDLGTRRFEAPMLVATYERAVESVTGNRYSLPSEVKQRVALDDVLDKHCPARDLGAREAWLREAVGIFAAHVDEEAIRFRGGHSPIAFQRWLNEGGLQRAAASHEPDDDASVDPYEHDIATPEEMRRRIEESETQIASRGNRQ